MPVPPAARFQMRDVPYEPDAPVPVDFDPVAQLANAAVPLPANAPIWVAPPPPEPPLSRASDEELFAEVARREKNRIGAALAAFNAYFNDEPESDWSDGERARWVRAAAAARAWKPEEPPT